MKEQERMSNDGQQHGDGREHDELEAALEAAAAPRDVVPRAPLTRETVERMATAAGSMVTFHEPGQPIYGPDGDLIGMTEPTTSTALLGGITITRAEADRLGFTGDEDGVHVVDLVGRG